MTKLFSTKFVLGAIFVFAGLLLMTDNLKIRAIQNVSSFESEPIELTGFNKDEISVDQQPEKIIIPSLNIFLDVRKASLKNGYWEVFDDVAGWGEGSGVPGKSGNQVIFAHAREGLFGSLRKAQLGTTILVLTEEKWYEYKVVSIDEVYPGNTKYIEQSENEILTLYTCSGFQDSKRLIVKADPV